MTLFVHSDNLAHRGIKVSQDAKRNYAFALRDLSTFYYDGQPHRRGPSTDTKLVEFWQNNEIEHHESRNRFFWVGGAPDSEKAAWHNWVVGKAADLIAASLPVGMPKPKAPDKKSPDVPNWAKPDNLIGYTCEMGFRSFSEFEAKENSNSLTWLPSVYYEGGHYTTQHADKGNVGWDDKSGWTRLCFANVPVDYLHGNYVPRQPVLVNLGGLHQGQGTFMFGYVNAFVVSLFPPNSYIVDLARPTGKNYSITRVTVPDELYQEPGHQSRHHRIKAN